MSLLIKVVSTDISDLTITENTPTTVMQNFAYNNVANGSVDVANGSATKTYAGKLRASHMDANGMMSASVDIGSLAPSASVTNVSVMLTGMTSSPDDLTLDFFLWPN